MKHKIGLVKRFALRLGTVSFLSLSVPASAAVLTLTDWTTLPFPPTASHADTYQLPFSLSATTPITQVEIDYRNQPFPTGAGIHTISSALFLFQSGDLASTTVFESTAERFWARIVFKTIPLDRRMTGLTNPSAPAFVAYHGGASGNALTSAQWTVTYANGSTQTSNNGIIPEPCTLASLAVSGSLAMLIRRRNRTGSAG